MALDIDFIENEIRGFLPDGTPVKIVPLEDKFDFQEVYKVLIGLKGGDEEFESKEIIKYKAMVNNLMLEKAITIDFNRIIKESRLKTFSQKMKP